ncbi:MAG TPA: ABC transporter permease [Candidatus Sulfotelmatobacter sp.]|nr:ABC transporter permease [Candidatus Sulfotelmatobacter sp.]
MTHAIDALGLDLRYAARGLRNTPGFTLTAVLTLAIGIGATTAVFSVINGVLLRPLPYPHADRLVSVSNVFPRDANFGLVSGTDVANWRADNHVFDRLEFVSHPDIVAMSGAGYGERVAVQHMTWRLLTMLGIKSFMGAIPDDDLSEQRGSPGVLISYEFWKRHFGADPKVLGQTIFVDTGSGPVVAVLQPGFDLFGTGVPDVFVIHGLPDTVDSGINDVRWEEAVGRLKPGVSIQQAQAAMKVRQAHLAQMFPETYKDVGVRVDPFQKRLFGNWAGIYYTLFGVVAFVLLIACANVANLLLVRGDARRKEVGVRVALGANRGSLIRQLLTESVLLSLIGGLFGLLLAFLGVKLFNFWAPAWYPRETGSILDLRVLLFTFGTCVLTGIAFGLVPAYRAVRTSLTECLQEGGRSTATISRHRTRNTLVVTEIALAFVLLIFTGLMINTLTRILRTSPGFASEHLLTAQVRLTGDKYIHASPPTDPDFNLILPPVEKFCDRILDRFRTTPGVEAVALIDWLPLLDGAGDSAQYASPGFTIVGQSASTVAEKPAVFREGVSADYFSMMRIPIVRGRGVSEQDTVGNAWVVVINQAMAKRYWPNQDPIGQEIKFDDSPEEKPRQIVGIVQDVKQVFLSEPAAPEAFVPYQQLSSRIYPGWTEARVHKSIIIRTHADPKALMRSMQRILAELAPESAIFGITTVERTVSESATPWRFLSEVLELFAGIALLLAVVGIYGVISYSVGERRHELGLRMAMGAQRKQVMGLVMRQAMVLSLVGVLIGVAGSFVATPLLAKFLYGVKPHDLLTLVLVSSLLMAVTLMASYVPARHATKIHPMQALRHE